jgi:PAS domain S-box-containing protein
MWVYDVHTLQILDANDAAKQRYGYSRIEFLGLTIKDLRPKEDVPKFLELIGAALSSKPVRNEETIEWGRA